MRIIEIIIGTILLGGAAWTMVRSYEGRGTSAVLVLAFAVFLVALGLLFVFGAFSACFVTSGSEASGSSKAGDLKATTPALVVC